MVDSEDPPLHRNEEWLRKKMYDEGKRPIDIVEEVDVEDSSNVANYLQQFFGCSAAYKDPEWVQERLDEGWDDKDLAEHCNACPATIRKWVNRHDIDHDFGVKRKGAKYRDADWLEKQYHEGHDQSEIAKMCDCSRATIINWGQKQEVDTRAKWKKESWIRSRIESGLRYREIGEIVGVSRSVIRNGVDKTGLKELYWEVHNIEDTEKKEKVELPEEKLRELFIRKGWGYKQIAKHLGTSHRVVKKRLRDYGINQKLRPAPLYLTRNTSSTGDNGGYMEWSVAGECITVHRLLMVAEHGSEAIKNMHVHHKSLRWDNRPETLEIMTPEEHGSMHGCHPHHTSDEREIHEVPRPPDPDQKEIDEFEPQDPLAF